MVNEKVKRRELRYVGMLGCRFLGEEFGLFKQQGSLVSWGSAMPLLHLL